MDIVYHGSPVKGLTQLEPKVSTHGVNYVYATKDKALALIFLQEHNDYLTNISYREINKLELTERCPNILEKVYKNKPGYLYYLNAENFLEGKTGFKMEVVSEQTENVIKCIEITDSYEALTELEKKGDIVIYRYPERPDYIPADDSDLIQKTKYFLRNCKDAARLIQYAADKHPNLKDELIKLLDQS